MGISREWQELLKVLSTPMNFKYCTHIDKIDGGINRYRGIK